MDVILTHEQADFDAMGAALGAFLMNEKAYPVTPRRMNRNVRAFLTLYGAELPFVDARDLPAEPIQTVTLVDTQSLITLKGMSQHTAVQVVDHHLLRPELPESWRISIDRTGACTTLFVEGLLEHNFAADSAVAASSSFELGSTAGLNPIHATLLLLGIYEDTGSLTYTSTTARDVRAAAFLLEQGANLQILSRYLNPPLSDEQRQVYDRLLSSADRHIINGQNILVARAHAEDLVDEISTIAHKLRDLLDPDALFLLVHTGEGIRLVARSVTDNVDVSKIAEHFGGGGHGRAAAALIRLNDAMNEQGQVVKGPTLEEVHTEMLQILPDHVLSSLTVRQLMSPRPLVLSPNTPAERAAQLMQRYGYEGYPVVQDGQVKGLLTRRAVDRALSHKLNLSASSLMESGEVIVHPQDSIEHLRRVMTDSGWGQIPVVDPESGKIIGIVTRTDLLKTMTDATHPGRQNLGARLDAALPPARLALIRAVAAKGFEQHMAIYVVGGFVRDLLLNRPSPDFDVVIEGDAIALANILADCYGGRLITHGRFGTAKWTIAEIRTPLAEALSLSAPVQAATTLQPTDLPDSLDLISARTEFYDYPTALPAVERSSIKLDLHRRDFTINTMALRLDGRHYGELYDYWGGLRDLRRGLVRVLHSLSFVDDPTRMMRAVRFEQRFDFQIEERTLQLIGEAREMIRHVSGDRLRHELNLILMEERPAAMLARLQDLNLLSSIHPALAWSDDFTPALEQVLRGKIDPRWILPEKLGNLPLRQGLGFLTWLMAFSIPDALSIAQRLRLPNDIQECFVAAKKLQEDLPGLVDAQPSQVASRLDQASPVALYLTSLFPLAAPARQLVERYRDIWRNTWPATNGDHLRQMGIQPGPHYRQILRSLRDAWLDGKITSVEEEKQLLQKLIQDLAV
jgi:tRNA nucleotidyltransferase (CCA-adding enzyme)